MTKSELHNFLTSSFELMVDPLEHGSGTTYFLQAGDWRPASTTRVVRVEYSQETVRQIRLCVSSDTNNSVFAAPPWRLPELSELVGDEVRRLSEHG